MSDDENDRSSVFSGLVGEDYRWPKKGDRLLRSEDAWERGVTFEEFEIARHVHIWEGYMKAGAALVNECERSDFRLDRHELAYPILFSYRHALELALKWIIGRYGRFAHVSPDDHRHHNLWDLWTACKTIILDVGSEGEDEALLAVQQVVKDFHELDKGSFSFRYSTDKEGIVISLPDVSFDLANIKDVMEGVNNFFTGVDGQLDANSGAMEWGDC